MSSIQESCGSFAQEWEAARDDYARATAVARSYGRRDGAGSLHECDLSGQWADIPSGPQVYADVLAYVGVDNHHTPDGEDWFTDVLDAYEDAYNTAAALTIDDE
jgi:hypothetical protein